MLRRDIVSMSFDLIVKNGVVATAADVGKYDIGVKDGKIAILAPSISADQFPKARIIDAEGGFVTVSILDLRFNGVAWRCGFSCSYCGESFYGSCLC